MLSVSCTTPISSALKESRGTTISHRTLLESLFGVVYLLLDVISKVVSQKMTLTGRGLYMLASLMPLEGMLHF